MTRTNSPCLDVRPPEHGSGSRRTGGVLAGIRRWPVRCPACRGRTRRPVAYPGPLRDTDSSRWTPDIGDRLGLLDSMDDTQVPRCPSVGTPGMPPPTTRQTEGDTRGGECCEVPRSIAVKKVLTAVGSTAACSFGRSGTRRRGQHAASARRQTQPPAVSAAVRRRAPLAGVAVRVHRLYGDLRNGNSGRTQRFAHGGSGCSASSPCSAVHLLTPPGDPHLRNFA
jgi:hypothetical protein